MEQKILNQTIEFTDEDHQCLRQYFTLAESVADLIGPHCEVVVHSLHNLEESVVKIVNGYNTQRRVGSPITNLGLKALKHIETTGELAPKSYFTKNKDGEQLKSTTSVIVNTKGRAVGIFCININLSLPFDQIVKTLMSDINQPSSFLDESFGSNIDEIIYRSLETAVDEIESDPEVNLKGKNKAITYKLMSNGIFELKGAINIASERLGITRHAIYKYIREFRADECEPEN